MDNEDEAQAQDFEKKDFEERVIESNGELPVQVLPGRGLQGPVFHREGEEVSRRLPVHGRRRVIRSNAWGRSIGKANIGIASDANPKWAS